MSTFVWSQVDEFLDRTQELTRLEEWWAGPEQMPINLYGRRRTGKSWLFRRLAHGKPAVLLVADKLSIGAQLARFAEALEPALGVRPALPDLASLFQVIFRAARERKLLVVIDEFPWLLSASRVSATEELSAIQAVIEREREHSKLKLILCGSLLAQMEALQSEANPLHGRLIPLQLRPLPFDDAALFLPGLAPFSRLERFAVAGGMPRYLRSLDGPSLRADVCKQLLAPHSPLWDEARSVLEQELREPRVYFAILAELAAGDRELNAIVQGARLSSSVVSRYLTTLVDLRVVSRRAPVGSAVDSRNGRWRLEDPFFRFWFRYVFPYQDGLENGLAPQDLYDSIVAPSLSEHVAPVFEEWCRSWTRAAHGARAQTVGAWWGPALHALRRTGERNTEEIDLVGLSNKRVTVVGEAKWTNKPVGLAVLTDLRTYKLPALEQAGLTLAGDHRTLLFGRGGYSAALRHEAERDPSLVLVPVQKELSTLR